MALPFDFTSIEYLKTGNIRQRMAYSAIRELELMTKLSNYDPLLTGTIPIGIDIPGSDLDIICCFRDEGEFTCRLVDNFSTMEKFGICGNGNSVISSFSHQGLEFEIFGQPIPTRHQNAYVHMIAEAAILRAKGEEFRRNVIELKNNGIKTEPAFAMLLGLVGDPYERILEIGWEIISSENRSYP